MLKVLNLELEKLKLAKQDALTFDGVVKDLLPNAMFKVELSNGHTWCGTYSR